MSGTCVSCNGCSHDAYGAGTCDQYIFTDKVEAQRRMNRITQRVKNSADIVADIVGQGDDIKRIKA